MITYTDDVIIIMQGSQDWSTVDIMMVVEAENWLL